MQMGLMMLCFCTVEPQQSKIVLLGSLTYPPEKNGKIMTCAFMFFLILFSKGLNLLRGL